MGDQSRTRDGAEGYTVIDPADDPRRDYHAIYDVSGDSALLDKLVLRLAPGGEIVLAGFYSEPLQFSFAPAFMREAQIRCAAEWHRNDLLAVTALAATGAFSLGRAHHAPRAGATRGRRLRHRFRRQRLPEDGPRLETHCMSTHHDSRRSRRSIS